VLGHLKGKKEADVAEVSKRKVGTLALKSQDLEKFGHILPGEPSFRVLVILHNMGHKPKLIFLKISQEVPSF
jgi:hypothetical protein